MSVWAFSVSWNSDREVLHELPVQGPVRVQGEGSASAHVPGVGRRSGVPIAQGACHRTVADRTGIASATDLGPLVHSANGHLPLSGRS